MDQPGKVTSSSGGQPNRENEFSPVPVREFGLARRVQPSRPASACSFSILRLNLVLTHGIPPHFHGGVHLFILTVIFHQVSLEFTGSRIRVPMAFTAESPPAEGQYSLR